MNESVRHNGTPQDLLVELGCEELPPKALDRLRQALFQTVITELEKQNIEFDADNSRAFSTPRRLAFIVRQVAPAQPDRALERRGPAINAAFDADGNPTGAAEGFARSVGREVSELETLKTDKGAWLFTRQLVPGKPLAELIYSILEQAIRQLPVPKPMRWADHDFSFVRPVHWLIVLHGDQVLPGSVLGQNAGRSSRGHRIHSPGPHRIEQVSDYERVLEDAFVVADPDRRRERIRRAVLSCSERVHIDVALLDEVNNLVEWPVPILCAFDPEFLEVPHAALVASMQDHQKFFPVRESLDSSSVTNAFIAVSNIESKNPDAVREGYERVIRPRLADARFFLQQDEKRPLEQYFERLDRVIFQEKIGTIGDKSRRISELSKKIADDLDADSKPCSRAATLSKCDLMTQMVGEFPELQGIMGRHYALSSGESEEIAQAIEEHYQPRFSGDQVPASLTGQIVSLADRLDSLVGIFAAGLRPTGNKDPFALRRAALGLIRILREARLDLSLDRLLEQAAAGLADQITVDSDLLRELREFITERARHHFRDQGYSAELINAALNSDWPSLLDLDLRITALSDFMGQEAAQSLAAANKRIGNILKKSDIGISAEINADIVNIDEERMLFSEVTSLEQTLDPLLQKGHYADALNLLSGLRVPVDAFFDSVMVMDENLELRNNRLALLKCLKGLFDRIADLSVLG